MSRLILRKDPLSLAHGKHSTVAFLQALVVGVLMFGAIFVFTLFSGALGVITCGLSHIVTMPLTMLAFGVFSERLFAMIQLEEPTVIDASP
jgi:hypothetical protein